MSTTLARCENVTGKNREFLLPAVWSMYLLTYAKIGTHLADSSELLDYDLWDVCFHHDGTPAQFGLWKTTKFGIKAGLSGHDGTPEARAAARDAIARKFKRRGYYGEVSHKVRDLVFASKSPVVCAVYASKVLDKEVVVANAIEYDRKLGSVGIVRKSMVGRPLGVPTTKADNPRCPLRMPRRRK